MLLFGLQANAFLLLRNPVARIGTSQKACNCHDVTKQFVCQKCHSIRSPSKALFACVSRPSTSNSVGALLLSSLFRLLCVYSVSMQFCERTSAFVKERKAVWGVELCAWIGAAPPAPISIHVFTPTSWRPPPQHPPPPGMV